MKDKKKSLSEALKELNDNSVIMIGGFLGCGCPNTLIDEVIKSGAQNLTVIANDSTFEGVGVGKLIASGQVKKLIASHIGTNPQTGQKMNSSEIEVELAPQGTLVERIRAAGAGLGGVLTPTGLGTVIEEGKEKVTVDGKAYLLEKPMRADIALVKANKADTWGNLFLEGSTRNFNVVMATAADYVVAETDECVPLGGIAPAAVTIPGLFVDVVVVKE